MLSCVTSVPNTGTEFGVYGNFLFCLCHNGVNLKEFLKVFPSNIPVLFNSPATERNALMTLGEKATSHGRECGSPYPDWPGQCRPQPGTCLAKSGQCHHTRSFTSRDFSYLLSCIYSFSCGVLLQNCRTEQTHINEFQL